MKIGTKTFIAVSSSAAKKATVNFVNSTISVGGSKVVLSKGRMQHILQRHHPSYWNGTVTKKQSFFDPSLRVNDIKNIVHSVVRGNSSEISRNVSNRTKSVVFGRVNGVRYRVSIDSSGHVTQVIPVE